jgi:hypothetical protein
VIQALVVVDTVRNGLPENDGVLVAQGVPLTLKLLVTVPVGERLGEPLDDAHAVAHPLAEGVRVAEAHSVAVPDTLEDPVEERQRETVGVMDGLAVLDAHRVKVGELEKLAVEQPVGEEDREEEGQTVVVAEKLEDPEEDRQCDGVGVMVGL